MPLIHTFLRSGARAQNAHVPKHHALLAMLNPGLAMMNPELALMNRGRFAEMLALSCRIGGLRRYDAAPPAARFDMHDPTQSAPLQ